jgi:dipeptidyl aminopeptidase/acylaminoacyl peptidase
MRGVQSLAPRAWPPPSGPGMRPRARPFIHPCTLTHTRTHRPSTRTPLSPPTRARASDAAMPGPQKAQTPVAWPSPITSDLLTAASTPRSEAAWGVDGALWWVEGRPSEGGRSVLVRRDVAGGGAAADVTPKKAPDGDASATTTTTFNVRTRVHEYGGGAYLLLPGEHGATRALFSNFGDSRLYSQTVPAGWDGAAPLAPPTPLTPPDAGLRFSDGTADPARPDRAIFVVEDHGVKGRAPTDPESYLAAVDLNTGALTRLTHAPSADAAGAPRSDFVSTPRLSPDGTALAWVAWEHPNMPWDETSLWVASVEEAGGGALSAARRVAGGAGKGESVLEPVWVAGATNAGAGGLAFISDRTDWWSLYFIPLGAGGGGGGGGALPAEGAGDPGAASVAHLTPGGGEWAGPQWILGLRQLQWVAGSATAPGRLLARWADPERPGAQAVLVSTAGERTPIPSAFTGFGRLAVRAAAPSPSSPPPSITLATVGSSLDRPAELATLEVSTQGGWAAAAGGWRVHATAADGRLDAGFITRPSVVEFPTDPLPGDGPASPPRTAFLNYYPPAHPDHALPPGTPPPCLFRIHGGPTAQSPAAFSLGTLFWTSRGFAVADVNYGGSTGYGRAFRARLNGNWGLVDVADVAAAARHLASSGLADPGRCCITGGSAGGFTVMAALAFRPGVFAAGTSHYGVADCSLLAAETHKFESRYLDGLIGPWPAARATYEARSPIHALDKVTAPLALFQGADDKVVPPNQAEAAFQALAGRGIPTTLVLFEGEGHGFRGAAAVRSALDGELYFYGKTLGLPTGAFPEGLTKPVIVNAPAEKLQSA